MFNYKHIALFTILCLCSELLKCISGIEIEEKHKAVLLHLHKDVNYATGKREVKLFDSNVDPRAESKRLALISIDKKNVSSHEDFIKETLTKIFTNDVLSKEELRDVLLKLNNGFENIGSKKYLERIKKKIGSYLEMKKQLGDLKLKMKTDSNLMEELKDEYKEEQVAQQAVRKTIVPEVSLYSSGNIVVGAGYSSDSQQVVPQICYNATVSSTSKQQGYIQLDTAMSYSELETILGISVGIRGTYLMFSAGAEASYIRSIQDKDYSLSLNYIECIMSNVAVQITGYGEPALTTSGQAFYNGGKNPYFGLFCGDNYISSYKQGALLIMGLNIKFSSFDVKNEFIEKAGVTFGNIISATESIRNVFSNGKVAGTVIVQAFQIGGDPTRLSKILNKDSSGAYYALTCSLSAIANCIKAASGLLDYAKSDFSMQIKNNTNMAPLGISFTQFTPIERIGLKPPISLVTEDVVQYRDELSNYLKCNEYYKEKLYPFFNQGYPVQLDTIFMMKANLLLSKANSNINLLMEAHKGAADCFNLPEKCKLIKSRIDSQLQNIAKNDLKFLDNIKYTVTTLGGLFYNIGQGLATSWRGVTHESTSYILAHVRNVSITDVEYSYHIDVRKPGSSGWFEYKYHGVSTISSMEYKGQLCYYPNTCRFMVETKQISPFYFEPYSNNIVTFSVNLIT